MNFDSKLWLQRQCQEPDVNAPRTGESLASVPQWCSHEMHLVLVGFAIIRPAETPMNLVPRP